MTKKHEELVEEIAKKIWAIHAFPRGETDWDRAVKQAEHLINLVLSAFHDGRLDEELGVVGRGTMELFIGEKQSCWAGFLLTEKPIANQAPTFIALLPLTGTGKEEEK